MSPFRHIFIGIAMAATLQSPALADYSKRVCAGEDQANGCPVSHDIMFGCYPAPQQMGDAACSIYENGQKKTLPFHIDHQGSHSGGKCGYEWYLVTCITN